MPTAITNRFCPHCHAWVATEAHVCPKCKSRLETVTPTVRVEWKHPTAQDLAEYQLWLAEQPTQTVTVERRLL